MPQALPVPSEGRRQAPAAVGIVHLPGGALPQRRLAMLSIMECFEARQLCRPVGPVAEGLAPPEALLIHLVKALDNPMAPGFLLGDEDHRHARVQAQADAQAKTAPVPVGAAQGEFRVHRPVAGTSASLPAGHQCFHHIRGWLSPAANATAGLSAAMPWTP
jgi:hypothetical protein